MSEELDLLRQIAVQAGYRFEKDDRGVERVFKPDGTLALTASQRLTESPPPADLPPDVQQIWPSGGYFRIISEPDPKTGGTNTIQAPVCEDCWQNIPAYVDFPRGLTSPESDGDAGGNFAKTRLMAVGDSGKMGMAHLEKVLCLPCYLKAFARVYPGAELPEFRDTVFERRAAVKVEAPAEEIYVTEPKPRPEELLPVA